MRRHISTLSHAELVQIVTDVCRAAESTERLANIDPASGCVSAVRAEGYLNVASILERAGCAADSSSNATLEAIRVHVRGLPDNLRRDCFWAPLFEILER